MTKETPTRRGAKEKNKHVRGGKSENHWVGDEKLLRRKRL